MELTNHNVVQHKEWRSLMNDKKDLEKELYDDTLLVIAEKGAQRHLANLIVSYHGEDLKKLAEETNEPAKKAILEHIFHGIWGRIDNP